MRKWLIISAAVLLLLIGVSCNNDPYLYRFDATSYLGFWEINVAPLEGDVDGCTHLLQYEFKSDLTYSLFEYVYNANTGFVKVIENPDGVFTFDYDENTGIGTITLDGGPFEYYWTIANGLSTFNLIGRQYNFNRPKHIIRRADDQMDLAGIWEYRNYVQYLGGGEVRQIEFKSDGNVDLRQLTGVSFPVQTTDTYSWRYMEGDIEKSYSSTLSVRWEYGSETYVSDPSTIGVDLHDDRYIFNEYLGFIINDNGEEYVEDIGTASYEYVIYQYGDKKLLKYDGTTYVRVYDRIDPGMKYRDIVHSYVSAIMDHLYLRSDGSFSSNIDDLLNYSSLNDAGYYTGTYTASYNEVTSGDVVAFLESKYRNENPGVIPVGGWDAWRYEQALAIETQKLTHYVKMFTGTITFKPNFGFEETFDILLIILEAKYGIENPIGKPNLEYDMYIKNKDHEGTISYIKLN